MKRRDLTWLHQLAFAGLAAAALLLALGGGETLRSSPAWDVLSAVRDYDEALARYRDGRGGLPGEPTLRIEGREIALRVIARSASAVPNPPRGRNLIELSNLPCAVAQDLEARFDDGNFGKGVLRASVEACEAGGLNDPVPVMAFALQR